jgi:hypothetical protein
MHIFISYANEQRIKMSCAGKCPGINSRSQQDKYPEMVREN